MTITELHDAIFADPTAKGFADVGNDVACAARMTAILPPTVVRRMADWSTIASAFSDPSEGFAAVQALEAAGESNPVAAFFIQWLAPTSPSGLDLGNSGVRGMLDLLVAGSAITSDQASAIKTLAEVPTAISHGQVSDAWIQYRPGGIVGGSE